MACPKMDASSICTSYLNIARKTWRCFLNGKVPIDHFLLISNGLPFRVARKGQSLSESQIRQIIREIAQGVKYLHDQAVVHRDLKPQNVLMNADGRVKIADYGLARMYSLQAALTTVVVTLWYRSPELLLQCDYGFGVDVWSVGCIMAEMYRLRALFPGDTEVNQLIRILQ